MRGYIYKIQSKINGKVYIGLTTREVDERWNEHKKDLRLNSHHNKYLQNHYNKYGDVYTYTVLNYASDKLMELEKFYIDKYNSFYEGFNLTFGGECFYNHVDSEIIAEFKKLLYFGANMHEKMGEDFGTPTSTIPSVKNGGYPNVDFSFKDYEDYTFYKELSFYYKYNAFDILELFERISNDEMDFNYQYSKISVLLNSARIKDDFCLDFEISFIREAFNEYYNKFRNDKKANIEKILKMYIDGFNFKEISVSVGVDQSHVSKVVNNIKGKNKFIELREKIKAIENTKENKKIDYIESVSKSAIILKQKNPNITWIEIAEKLNVKRDFIRSIVMMVNYKKYSKKYHTEFKELWNIETQEINK